jgi:starvation-inducible DNA-binding protein
MSSVSAILGLSNETVSSVHNILRKTLANESLYQIKLKQFHWNVKGPQFSQYHELFEEMYISLTEVIDDTAERIRAL